MACYSQVSSYCVNHSCNMWNLGAAEPWGEYIFATIFGHFCLYSRLGRICALPERRKVVTVSSPQLWILAATEDAKLAEVKEGAGTVRSHRSLWMTVLVWPIRFVVHPSDLYYQPNIRRKCHKSPKKQERINHSSWCLGEHFYLGRVRQIRQG